MREERFSSWEAFRSFVDRQRSDQPVYWRGQVEREWPLSSSFDRMILQLLREGEEGIVQLGDAKVDFSKNRLPEGFVARVRDLYLEQFKEAATGLRGANPASLDNNQWWALGRHYGLISPLLDWTEKPYIAAFFALTPPALHHIEARETSRDKQVAIYRLLHTKELEGDGLKVLRIRVDELPRLHDQRGIFTLLEREDYFSLESFLEENGRGHLLSRIVLSGDALIEGAIDLEDHGLDYRHLFPDLSGSAAHANVLLQRMALRTMTGLRD